MKWEPSQKYKIAIFLAFSVGAGLIAFKIIALLERIAENTAH